MEFTVAQIAEILNGTVEGDGEAKLSSFGKIQEAGDGVLSFLANDKYEQFIYSSEATAIIVSKGFAPTAPVKAVLIRVEDPYASFSALLEFYEKATAVEKLGVEEPAFIGEATDIGENHYRGAFSYIGSNCTIGKNVKIYPHSYIGDGCVIGDHSIIFPGAKIYPGTKIGKNCLVHAGAVLGSDGFGWAPQADGTYSAIPQLGNVELEDNVSIGANTTIDCSTFPNSPTLIKKGSKIDNLVMLAHNVVVGKDTVIAAQTGISGSTTIGESCIIAGQVGIVGHLDIADKTTIAAQTGVSRSIKKEGETIFGTPGFNIRQFMSSYAVFKKLPEIYRRLSELEKKS